MLSWFKKHRNVIACVSVVVICTSCLIWQIYESNERQKAKYYSVAVEHLKDLQNDDDVEEPESYVDIKPEVADISSFTAEDMFNKYCLGFEDEDYYYSIDMNATSTNVLNGDLEFPKIEYTKDVLDGTKLSDILFTYGVIGEVKSINGIVSSYLNFQSKDMYTSRNGYFSFLYDLNNSACAWYTSDDNEDSFDNGKEEVLLQDFLKQAKNFKFGAYRYDGSNIESIEEYDMAYVSDEEYIDETEVAHMHTFDSSVSDNSTSVDSESSISDNELDEYALSDEELDRLANEPLKITSIQGDSWSNYVMFFDVPFNTLARFLHMDKLSSININNEDLVECSIFVDRETKLVTKIVFIDFETALITAYLNSDKTLNSMDSYCGCSLHFIYDNVTENPVIDDEMYMRLTHGSSYTDSNGVVWELEVLDDDKEVTK